MAAVGGDPVFVGGVPLPEEELLGQAHIDVVPCQEHVLTEAPGGVALRVNAALLECVDPGLVLEILVPAVQHGTIAGSFRDDTGDPAVAASHDGL